MKKIKKLLPFILFLITFSVFSQTGFVTGTVSDGELNDILPYANVVVKNTTKGTTTDFDGKYNLELEAGTYTIEYSFLGYETKAITDVVVIANQDVVLDVSIKPANSLDEVVITTSSKRNTESALLNIQKKSVVMLDGLSLQSIKKTGAGDIASAVKSVPGVSVQGGKYVYVRGLGDRYTKSILNGVDIPGLDPDRNTIPMDIFPTNIIDNVIVLKSASAEYPADFTGGIVNIVTKDFPTKAEYSLSVGTGYNPDMHFNDNYLNYEGSKSDFLGYDNGLRNRKINRYQSIPATFENKQLLTSLTSRFESQLGADVERSNANFNFGFTLGNQYEVNDTDRIGYQASFNYKNTTRFYEDRVDGNYTRDLTNGNLNNELVTDRIVTGSSGHNEVLVNGLLGLTYKTERSKYKLTGLHIQNGESTAGKYNLLISEGGAGGGLLNASGDELLYTQRSITNFSLVGDHALDSNNDLTLDWVFSPSFSSVQDKDHRTTALRQVDVGNEIQYQIDPSSVGNPTRIWRNLSEENWVLNANMSKKYQLFNKPAKVKFGGGFTYKYRDFNTDQYLFEATSPIVENGDVNTILAEENLWTPSTGTGTYLDSNNIFQPENSYEGESNIASFYISNEFNVTEKLKAILGVRSEQFLSFYTGIIDGESVTGQKTFDNIDLFPSANLIYALNDDSNFRASYSRTTARPSFKEASTAAIFDPITNRFFIGGLGNGTFDPVRQSYINNFDLRYEIFREGGQMIAISGFYKNFTDPIELTFFPQAFRQVTAANTGDANVIGGEIEFRQNLDFIGLSKFKFNTNVSVIKSEVTMLDQEFNLRSDNARSGETVDRERDLQGQSPYLINAGLDYDNEDGFRAGVFYNVQGKTLEVVGNGFVPDVYTQPFHSLNFTLNKSFGENRNSSIDLKVNNILGDQRESFYEAFGAQDQIFSSRFPGTEISLGYSYKF